MSSPTFKYTIEMYTTEDNQKPFLEWMHSLSDKKAGIKILDRIDRVQLGNLGNYKSLKNGIFELKIYFGPGYRIYFAYGALDKILILYGGTKATQRKDIEKAKKFYQNYITRGDTHA